MFPDVLLKYALPDTPEPSQRVALRPTAIFIGAFAVAMVLAFGRDTLGVISYWLGRAFGGGFADVPLTATTLSVVAIIALFGLSKLLYDNRDALVRFWATRPFWMGKDLGGGQTYGLLDAIGSLVASVQNLAKSKQKEEEEALDGLKRQIGGLRATLDQRRILPRSDVSAWPTLGIALTVMALVIAGVGYWFWPTWYAFACIGIASLAASGAIALLWAWGSQSTEIERLDARLARLSTARDLTDAATDTYKEEATKAAATLAGLVVDLNGQLSKLLTYIRSRSSDPPKRSQSKSDGNTSGEKGGEGKGASPQAELPIEALTVECTMVDQLRQIQVELSEQMRDASAGALLKGDVLAAVNNINQSLSDLRLYVEDHPYLPDTRELSEGQESSVYLASTQFGRVLTRTSLGIGNAELKRRQGSFYFSSASTSDGSRQSSPARLEQKDLDACDRQRSLVYTSAISAMLCMVFAILIGGFGPLLCRPTYVACIVWLVLAFAACWVAIGYLRTGSIAAVQLAARESVLWQQALREDPPQDGEKWPKRLLLSIAPWRPQASTRSLVAWPFLVFLFITIANALYITSGRERLYLIPVVSEPLANRTRLTATNIPLLVRMEPIRRKKAPEFRSPDVLANTVLPAGCRPTSPPANDQTTTTAPGEILRPMTFDPSDTALYVDCVPVIGWPSQQPTVVMPVPPVLTVQHLTIAPPVIQYSGVARTVALQAEPPTIEYDGIAAPASLTANQPEIDWLESNLSLRSLIRLPWAPVQQNLKLPPLKVEPPAIDYTAIAKTEDLPAAPPTIRWADATESGPRATASSDVSEWSTTSGPLATSFSTAAGPTLKMLFSPPWRTPPEPGLPSPPLTLSPPALRWNPGAVDLVGALAVNAPWRQTLAPPSVPFLPSGTSNLLMEASIWFKVYCPYRGDRPDGIPPGTNCDDSGHILNEKLNAALGSSPDQLQAQLRDAIAAPDTKFMLVGHADIPGKSELNATLSHWRASYVKTMLFGEASDRKGRIMEIPMGDFIPWVPQVAPSEAQELNRRVDIYVFK